MNSTIRLFISKKKLFGEQKTIWNLELVIGNLLNRRKLSPEKWFGG